MDTLLIPLLVQMGLAATVLPFVAYARSREIKKDPALMQRAAADISHYTDDSQKIANNFNNLFQMPVLFYVLCILGIIAGVNTLFALVTAWIFVFTRILHTVVHTTSNHVPTRFMFFGLGIMALLAFGVAVLADGSGTLVEMARG